MTNDQPDGLEGAARARAMAAVALSILLSVLDYAVANVALPTLAYDLYTTPSASIFRNCLASGRPAYQLCWRF